MFAKHMIQRLGPIDIRRPHDITPVRTKVRTVARLLMLVKQYDDKLSMTELLKPQHFEELVRAGSNLAKQNPQIGLTIGGYIKQLMLLKISEAIKTNDFQKEEETKKFQYLFDAHWNSAITSVANKQQRYQRINIQHELPLTSDLRDFSEWLKTQILKETEVERLRKLIMTYLILFNKRRPMEVAELTITNYRLENSQTHNHEVMNSLSETEKILAKRYICAACFT